MQIALLSDIHGNARALKAVLKDIRDKNIRHVYILGDLCYRGPEPKNTLETIRSIPAKVLKGNADEWIVRGIQKGEAPEHLLPLMRQEREWALERLTSDDIHYLENLPESFYEKFTDHVTMHAFHATPRSLFETVLSSASDEELEQLVTNSDANVIVYGHIHTPFIRKVNGRTFINTGSVGLPFDGDPRPSYALLTIEEQSVTASIERVSYDISKVVRQYEANDYPNSDQMKSILQNGRQPS
ncbi:metallophosphoesterase family protein [Aliibacillus thermotolerans]|uniref:Phosphoesterase n=1 Tax=Aliibacillus thermotolerans TaxID=1834418 RepID=A0ABW0U7S3_9BACI|nr:YfcE family phosphodiesterase [Aliibacillus thermotolerans]MDA3130145.1 YfcE family phosphodiesterase [Aliibacillus thermotolerans]